MFCRTGFCLFIACLFFVFDGIVMAVPTPYASQVVSYSQGPGSTAGYDNPQVVLGAPPVEDSYGFGISITAGPWEADDVLSLGNGGSVTIMFDHPVVDNPADVEYGIDLLVFGNSFFGTDWEGDGSINQTFFEPATIEVSQDGVNFYEIADIYADALYPYTAQAGDFLHATPAGVEYMGRQPADVFADYAGGCGGAQVDIANAFGVTAPLGWIQYVRVTDVAGDSGLADVVGFADVVPEPASMLLLGCGIVLGRRKR